MNLKEMKSMTLSLVGDPRGVKITPGELITYLNMGQFVVSGILVNVEREKYLTQASRTVGASIALDATDGEYTLPYDCRDLVRVTFNDRECRKIPAADVNALLSNTLYRPIRNVSHFYIELGGKTGSNYIGANRIRLFPKPESGDSLDFFYYKNPTKFDVVGAYDGALTSVAIAPNDTRIFFDSSVPFAGSATTTGLSGWWNDAEIYFKTGALTGIRRRITSFAESSGGVYGSFTLSTADALGVAPSAGNQYEVAQVSVTPDQYHHLICYYAAALGAGKAQVDPKPFWETFNAEIQLVKTKWVANVDANLVGQITTGTRQYRRAEN